MTKHPETPRIFLFHPQGPFFSLNLPLTQRPQTLQRRILELLPNQARPQALQRFNPPPTLVALEQQRPVPAVRIVPVLCTSPGHDATDEPGVGWIHDDVDLLPLEFGARREVDALCLGWGC